MDLEWCFSADGVQWQRPARQAWIPRGKPPEPDCYGIYAPHALVERGGRWADPEKRCRAAQRDGVPGNRRYPSLGFRLALRPMG